MRKEKTKKMNYKEKFRLYENRRENNLELELTYICDKDLFSARSRSQLTPVEYSCRIFGQGFLLYFKWMDAVWIWSNGGILKIEWYCLKYGLNLDK